VTTLTIPWLTLLAVLAGAALVGLIAAVLPARRAAALDVLTALAAT
jgi:putative ABC transport system permease protein